MEEAAQKPRLDVMHTDDFDEENPFTEGNAADEVELQFDGRKSLFVSKTFLSYSSPVFARMFQSGFKETDSNIIDLKHKSYETFLEMFRFLHPRVQKPLQGKTAKDIYLIAHEYQIPTALKQAETTLLTNISSQGSAAVCRQQSFCNFDMLEMLKFAEAYNNTSLLSAAAERVSLIPMDRFTRFQRYKDLDESTKNKILMYRLKRCDKGQMESATLDLVY